MISKEERIRKIKHIIETEKPIMEGIKRKIRGNIKEFKVYNIPLNLLIYNHLNGRFASKFKTAEAVMGKKISAERQDDVELIESWLWSSNEGKNKKTLSDLITNKQKEPAMITIDGRVIDGNRRLMLINKLFNNPDEYSVNPNDYNNLFAIVLPEDVSETELELLETEYQLGDDEKVDYNVIDKYLKVDRLRNEYNEPLNKIAELMYTSKKEIENILRVLQVMQEYLDYIGHPNEYDLLTGKEDQFKTLESNYSSIQNHNRKKTEWNYSNSDINDLKDIAFNYISAGCDHREFRKFFEVFDNKSAWEDFRDKHYEVSERVRNFVKCDKQLKNCNPADKAVKEAALWKEHAREEYIDCLDDQLKHIKEANKRGEPLKIVENIRKSMSNIDAQILIKHHGNNQNMKQWAKEIRDFFNDILESSR